MAQKTAKTKPAEKPEEKQEKKAPPETPRPAAPKKAGKGLSIEEWLSWSTLVVSALLALLFLLDVVAGMPFGGQSTALNIMAFVACGLTAYLAWNALRDFR